MRLLASGIDTLNLSVRGAVQESVWDLLAEVQKRARVSEDDEMVSFPITEEAFECRPYGWRGYTYWLSSHDFELMVGRSTKFRAVLVQLHSAFLHSMGIDASVDQVERLLRLDVLAGPFKEAVSRIDLHADVQDWKLQTADLDRFVGYGRHRRAFEENRQVFQSGTKLSGFIREGRPGGPYLRQDGANPEAGHQLASRSLGRGVRPELEGVAGEQHRWGAEDLLRKDAGGSSEEVRDAVEKRDAGMQLTGRAPTLERWLAGWLESLRRGAAVRPLTLRSYEGYCRRDIIPALGRVRLDQLSRSRIQAFLDEQATKGRAA
jgi:hypothetical protein